MVIVDLVVSCYLCKPKTRLCLPNADGGVGVCNGWGCEEARLSKGGEFTFQNATGLRLGLIV